MPLNIENEFNELRNQRRMLNVLRRKGPCRPTELLKETRFSSRTLWKHLNRLRSRGLIVKPGTRYELTKMGLEFLGPLEDQLQEFDRYRKIRSSRTLVRDYAVEVTAIGAHGAQQCLGIFHVTRPGALEPQEHKQMDRALTKAMHIISDAIPEGSKEFGVRITGTLK